MDNMTIYGMKFMYGAIQFTERELRVARYRVQAAGQKRNLARKFAAATKKTVKEDLTVVEHGSRLARCRAEAAGQERNLARKFAASYWES